MKLPIVILFLFVGTGCVCLNPDHRQVPAPSVTTERVIEDLKETKQELVKAGEANTEVGKSVNKALTLAERLDAILEEIEKQQQIDYKNIIEPVK